MGLSPRRIQDKERKTTIHWLPFPTFVKLARSPRDRFYFSRLSYLVELEELGLVNCPNAELSFDGGNERRSLEEGTREAFQCATNFSFSSGNVAVETG